MLPWLASQYSAHWTTFCWSLGRLPTQSRFRRMVMIHPCAVLFLDEGEPLEQVIHSSRDHVHPQWLLPPKTTLHGRLWCLDRR